MLGIETDSYRWYRYFCKLFLKNNFLKSHKMDIKKGKKNYWRYIKFIQQTTFFKELPCSNAAPIF